MESEEEEDVRGQHHGLLTGLKSTVEGLLATNSTNVWNTYGGLTRLCTAVEKILNHKLKVTQTQFGNTLDYWNFIKGLKWLNPVLAPSIEQINRQAGTAGDLDLSRGHTWVKQSLQNHNLSSQLHTLVENREHLKQHYEESAFLRHHEYMRAMLICLQAVENNRVALLAEINPLLLRTGSSQRTRGLVISHVRSSSTSSLPATLPSSSAITMPRRVSETDPLAPPLPSPKSDSVLETSAEHATATLDSSPEVQPSAKAALLSVLEKDGSSVELESTLSFPRIESDPLLNTEFFPEDDMLSHVEPLGVSRSPHRASFVISGSPHTQAVIGNKNPHTVGVSRSLSVNTVHHRQTSVPYSPRGQQGSGARLSRSVSSSNTEASKVLDNLLNSDSTGDDSEGTNLFPRTNLFNQHSVGLDTLPDQNGNVSLTGTQNLFEYPTGKRNGVLDKGKEHSTDDSKRRSLTDEGTDSKGQSKGRKISHIRSRSDGATLKEMSLDDPADQSDSTLVDPATYSSSLPAHAAGGMGRKGNAGAGALHPGDSTESFLSRPAEGQSLINYLQSQDFSYSADLDKENAHFSISEALIAAIEQMKWNQVIRPFRESDEEEADSDEEIQQLKQRIRIRRRERLKEKHPEFPAFSDGKTDTTNSTASNLSSSHDSSDYSDIDSGSDEVEDREIEDSSPQESSNLASLQNSCLSLSMASLYNDAELQKANSQVKFDSQSSGNESSNFNQSGNSGNLSAESVAIALLKRFSEHQLPKASDLEWLVSEQDVPQKLLPLPDSLPISPDDSENLLILKRQNSSAQSTRLRGNFEWAPPRPQIIFNIHPTPKRKVLIAKQNYRCAGCGTKVETGYIKRYRYCEYLGKYFCQCCHSSAITYIPGRILRKWDFTKYPVSNFSRDLLQKMHTDPLFSIQDINPTLYRRVKALDTVKEFRRQLFHFRRFVKTCRLGQSLFAELESLPSSWLDDVHVYSIADLIKVRSGEMYDLLKKLVTKCYEHTRDCPLCQAKGFFCEFCNNRQDVIFPFELHKVENCPSKCCRMKILYDVVNKWQMNVQLRKI
ncbi:run domain Beclin-1-interacting and cysteine-rich domain-containing protein-like [Lingula anatina]|uniref:Run domain Beclin-1-interacting and cysteine-rich domain-containing protein-like n=1 Tax=Lingula anatina TaxID=7574 RepID=A0A1S3JHB4_LINAN|nr:run domain Beclin-1-interacting and cysteine-rich domain-containing protein-like [Lingula anatina]|eukprot:XP_013409289.1 run domain Beclin-1-interacting and cysteine-rich domain-containing protein-like [Lingula anatina]